MGGFIVVSSEVGQGTVFTVEMPVKMADELAKPDEESVPAQPAFLIALPAIERADGEPLLADESIPASEAPTSSSHGSY